MNQKPNSSGLLLILSAFLVPLLTISNAGLIGWVVCYALLAVGCSVLWRTPPKRTR